MNRDDSYWIDQLRRKHECMPYDSERSLVVTADGVSYRVIVPKYLPEMEPRVTALQGELLFVTGVTGELDSDRPTGFVMIARRETNGNFSAVVWHETYSYAVEHLGLTLA